MQKIGARGGGRQYLPPLAEKIARTHLVPYFFFAAVFTYIGLVVYDKMCYYPGAMEGRVISVTQKKIDAAFSTLILSVSGWRKVFAASGDEDDSTAEILAEDGVIAGQAAAVFAEFLLHTDTQAAQIVVAEDSRPTGNIIAGIAVRVFRHYGFTVHYLGVAAAPEVFCYARKVGAFFYVSASHNPIGHNGIKLGLHKGGVLDSQEITPLIQTLKNRCADKKSIASMTTLLHDFPHITACPDTHYKQAAFDEYYAFTQLVAAPAGYTETPADFFEFLRACIKQQAEKKTPVILLADFNGSARAASIDAQIFSDLGVHFFAMNDAPGNITHGIIPEGDNLRFCAEKLARLQTEEPAHAHLLGYMPDCDGDRGNIVFWNAHTRRVEIPHAQEVFALSLAAELCFLHYSGQTKKPIAIVVNDATSMRVEAIADLFDAEVFRAEVGEAHVVGLARTLSAQGYLVRMLGEGSNGGAIISPAAVRDPINTLFSILKLLIVTPQENKKGLFQIYCERAGIAYPDEFGIETIQSALPVYCTTAAAAEKARLKIAHVNQCELKRAYQAIFEHDWKLYQDKLKTDFAITHYEAAANSGQTEMRGLTDFGTPENGGLKIMFYTTDSVFAFIWMRKSGTEPIIRLMADIRGDHPQAEHFFLTWQTDMLKRAAAQAVRTASRRNS